jgi:hypothetical protein
MLRTPQSDLPYVGFLFRCYSDPVEDKHLPLPSNQSQYRVQSAIGHRQNLQTIFLILT